MGHCTCGAPIFSYIDLTDSKDRYNMYCMGKDCGYVSDICTPYRVWLLRREVSVKDVLEPVREILTMGSDGIGFYPTCPDAHFLHVSLNCSFCSIEAFFM